MTFSPTDYQIWYKDYPMFSLWAIQKGSLFTQEEFSKDDDFKKWDLTSKIYILMKRLGQDYNRIMLMDANDRDTLFEMEMKLIQEEQKQKDNISKK